MLCLRAPWGLALAPDFFWAFCPFWGWRFWGAFSVFWILGPEILPIFGPSFLVWACSWGLAPFPCRRGRLFFFSPAKKFSSFHQLPAGGYLIYSGCMDSIQSRYTRPPSHSGTAFSP